MYFVGLTVSKARHGDSPFELLLKNSSGAFWQNRMVSSSFFVCGL
jgi:hypothetical protein